MQLVSSYTRLFLCSLLNNYHQGAVEMGEKSKYKFSELRNALYRDGIKVQETRNGRLCKCGAVA